MDSKNIIEHFGGMPDPREDNRRHLLIDIVAIVICASTCGAEKWEDIEAFGKAKEKWLATFLSLPHGIPSHDTFARVFAMLDPQQLNERFVSWVKQINPYYQGEVISIDGKTARSSYDSSLGKSALHMVSAWANKAGLTLAQQRTAEKSNEITAIPEVLRMLEIQGCVVTIDAIGTQTAIAEQIIDQGGDYVLALKGNQNTLHEDVELYFRDIKPNTDQQNQIGDYGKTVEKDHGRVETRECWATERIEWLEARKKWKGLRSICVVKAKRSIAGKRLLAGWDQSYLEKVLFKT